MTGLKTDLRDVLGACSKGFFAVVLFSLGINLLMLTAPLYMLQVFDRVLTSRSTETLVLLLLIAVVALGVHGLLDTVRGVVLLRIGSWIDRRIGGDIFGAGVLKGLSHGAGASVQGLRDLGTVRTFLSGPSIFPLLDAPWAPLFLAVMFLLHPLMGWLATVGAVILFAMALLNELGTRKLLAQASGATNLALRRAEAAARNADVVSGMGMMENVTARWQRENAIALDFQTQASSRGIAVSSASKFMRFCLQVGVMTIGAWLVIEGELTPGGMIAGSIIMGRALAPVEQAIGSWKSVVGARTAYGRVKAALAAAPIHDDGMPLPTPKGKLDVQGIAYLFEGSSEPLLRNITFELEPGDVLGLVGPTAAGKTTLARILIGNLKPRRGFVRLDAMDVSEWDKRDLGRHIGYLPQDVELFDGTVKENIARMGEGEPEAVIAAAQLAGVHDMVLGMAKGYDTPIGEGGMALSGGQRQRIGLARAVYGAPKFVVLDEPNANLDSDGEQALLSAIDRLRASEVTVVVIAHRPNVMQRVTKVLILKDGTVHMFGRPDQVVPQIMPPRNKEQEEGGAADAPKDLKTGKAADDHASESAAPMTGPSLTERSVTTPEAIAKPAMKPINTSMSFHVSRPVKSMEVKENSPKKKLTGKKPASGKSTKASAKKKAAE